MAASGETDRSGDRLRSSTLIRRLAERQHGVVAQRQLIAVGLSREQVWGRVQSGLLLRMHRGVYALGHLQIGREGEWMAAVLACGPSAYLSHGSAAALWGLRGAGGVPDVTRRSGGARHRSINLHQTRILEPFETTIEAGIPVTSMERTLLDISATLDERELMRAVVAADRSRRLRWAQLIRLTERTPRRSGAGRLRRVAGAVDPRAADVRSPLEADFLRLCGAAGLPMPHVNVLAEGHLVDFLWPAERVVVETDGYTFHGDRLSFERDHIRTLELESAGYRVHRATYGILEKEADRFLANVRRSLEPAST